MKLVLFAIVIILATDTYASTVPPDVAASIRENTHDCRQGVHFKPGFITRRDINGDGVKDFILDYGNYSCDRAASDYCGTAGCLTTVFASTSDGGYEKVLDENVQSVTFRKVRGKWAMLLGLHGSACGKRGFETCSSTLYWNGRKFSPARKIDRIKRMPPRLPQTDAHR